MTHRAVRWPSLVRWVHTYASLIVFAGLLFFSVTGVTLNHARYFEDGGEKRRDIEAQCPRDLCPEKGDVLKEPLVKWAKEAAALHGTLGDFNADESAVSFVFKGPAYSADVMIERETGKTSIREERLGRIAWLDDLHKGRDSGSHWSLVIDVSAVVMALSALTGLWLLFYVRRRRRSGLIVTLIGLAVTAFIAFCLIP